MKALSDFTPARVQLPTAGESLATEEVLAFQLAHAAARDAVHEPFDVTAFGLQCRQRGWPFLLVRSAASDRAVYLKRPDLGRRLGSDFPTDAVRSRVDVAIIIVDGLSALAVQRHALAVLAILVPMLDAEQWTRSELIVVEQGRVAIGDEIGALLNADLSLVLIGERPGLSSPDSLGAYLTWKPKIGRTDAERNCISNIRPEGLSYEAAARRICALLFEARRRQLTGVALKESVLSPLPSADRDQAL